MSPNQEIGEDTARVGVTLLPPAVNIVLESSTSGAPDRSRRERATVPKRIVFGRYLGSAIYCAPGRESALHGSVREWVANATTEMRNDPFMHDIRVVRIVACSPFPTEVTGVLRALVGVE